MPDRNQPLLFDPCVADEDSFNFLIRLQIYAPIISVPCTYRLNDNFVACQRLKILLKESFFIVSQEKCGGNDSANQNDNCRNGENKLLHNTLNFNCLMFANI